ncbi:hypothetical protein H4S01_003969, partial [Coemansia sp. RSA 2610]
RLVGARDKAGQTKLHRACCAGDLALVEALLAQGADVAAADNAGWTPLHEAALEGHDAVVAALLRRGADVAARGFGGDTPLHDACANGHAAAARRLLAAGAAASARNAKGTTPADMARDAGHDAVLELIAAHNERQEQAQAQPQAQAQQAQAQQAQQAQAQAQAQAQPLAQPQAQLAQLARSPKPRHRPAKRARPASPPSPARFLPLCTVLLHGDCFAVDLQVRLLLGMRADAPADANPLFAAYPHVRRRRVAAAHKEQLWPPLAARLALRERRRFVQLPLYFVRLDDVVQVVRRDYAQLAAQLATTPLDLRLDAPSPWTGPQPMMPLKYALKLHYAQSQHTPE